MTNLINKNVLLFERAGGDFTSETSNIGNHRIRTTFLNNEGKEIYLEVGGSEFNDKKNKRVGWESSIDHAFYIPTEGEDKKYLRPTNDMKGYTKEELTKWINKTFNCSFETVEALHNMEDYRVHGDNNTYNLMNNHIVNIERTQARIKAYEEIDMYFRNILNEKYSKISLLKMDDSSITVRCYTSKEKLAKVNLTDADRERTIIVKY